MKKAGRKTMELAMNIGSMEVENPLWRTAHRGDDVTSRYIKAAINVRESSITALFARKLILPHQKEAADRFRAYFEAMGGSGAPAIDYARDHVDGGRIAEPIKVQHLEAGRKLKEAHTVLGNYGFAMVSRICGEGYGVKDIATGRRAGDTLMDNLRLWLDELAGTWGLSTRAGVVGRNYRAKR